MRPVSTNRTSRRPTRAAKSRAIDEIHRRALIFPVHLFEHDPEDAFARDVTDEHLSGERSERAAGGVENRLGG
jgi:hypothetical protein